MTKPVFRKTLMNIQTKYKKYVWDLNSRKMEQTAEQQKY